MEGAGAVVGELRMTRKKVAESNTNRKMCRSCRNRTQSRSTSRNVGEMNEMKCEEQHVGLISGNRGMIQNEALWANELITHQVQRGEM